MQQQQEKNRCNQLNIESTNSCEGIAGVIFDMHQKNSFDEIRSGTHTPNEKKQKQKPSCVQFTNGHESILL